MMIVLLARIEQIKALKSAFIFKLCDLQNGVHHLILALQETKEHPKYRVGAPEDFIKELEDIEQQLQLIILTAVKEITKSEEAELNEQYLKLAGFIFFLLTEFISNLLQDYIETEHIDLDKQQLFKLAKDECPINCVRIDNTMTPRQKLAIKINILTIIVGYVKNHVNTDSDYRPMSVNGIIRYFLKIT